MADFNEQVFTRNATASKEASTRKEIGEKEYVNNPTIRKQCDRVREIFIEAGNSKNVFSALGDMETGDALFKGIISKELMLSLIPISIFLIMTFLYLAKLDVIIPFFVFLSSYWYLVTYPQQLIASTAQYAYGEGEEYYDKIIQSNAMLGAIKYAIFTIGVILALLWDKIILIVGKITFNETLQFGADTHASIIIVIAIFPFIIDYLMINEIEKPKAKKLKENIKKMTNITESTYDIAHKKFND